jgi:hypothetical protein
MRVLVRLFSIALLVAVVTVNSFGITWFPQDFNCPLDNHKNTFLVVGSYGSYIYSYPSKYQWLFFPRTDSPTYYTCKKCNLTTFMWDFDKLPKDKLDAIRKALVGVKVSKDFKKYTELPVPERLEIMEKVYSVLGKGEEWWEDFYRIKGYHYGRSGDETRAAEARRKSLALIEKELNKPKSSAPTKMLLYISGSMKHFLGDDKAALDDLNRALSTKYANPSESAEDVKGAEEGLNERLKDYIERIKSEKNKPRLFERGDSDPH